MSKKLRYITLFVVIALIGGLFLAGCRATGGEGNSKTRIYIEGNQFMVNGSPIWMSGGNVPWDNWNDFGGNMNATKWEKMFSNLHDAGVNSVRVWITCDGTVGIQFDENGMVTGATEKHWKDLDTLFELAKKYQIYVMATLMSFDHFKDGHSTTQLWRNLICSSDGIDSYVNNYVIPFVERYDSNDYLWSIDLCNEPDWIVENKECGQMSWSNLGSLFGKCAAAIHDHSDVLVTIGFGMIKYCSEDYTADYGSTQFLQLHSSKEGAYLDFNSVHYYEWQAPWFKNPVTLTPKDFGLNDSIPSVIGEMASKGLVKENDSSIEMSLTDCYENLYANGWNGLLPWTANGVDACGGYGNVAPATKAFFTKHAKLVFPNAN